MTPKEFELALMEAAEEFGTLRYDPNTCPTGNMMAKNIACKVGFRQGARWQRNHVWHNMKSEEPQAYGEYEDCIYPEIPCLVRGQLSTGYGYGVRYWNIIEKVWDDEECDDFECNKDDIEEWAYLDDLIPI